MLTDAALGPADQDVRTRRGRWVGAALAAAGAAFTLYGAVGLVDPDAGLYRDVLWLPCGLLVLLAAWLARPLTGRLGSAALALVALGLAGNAAGMALFNLDQQTELVRQAEMVVMVPAIFGLAAGFVVFGAAVVRSRLLPGWAGALLAVSPLLTSLAGPAGDAAAGPVWVAVGALLWTRGPRSVTLAAGTR